MSKVYAFIIACVVLLSVGCAVRSPEASAESAITVTDSAQLAVNVHSAPETVVALSSSIAEIWLLAGGNLAGVTDDALEERGLGLPEDITVLGTVKDPNLEGILALRPSLVLLSQDIASHTAIGETLRQADIACYTARVDTLDEYIKTLDDFAQITGDAESFKQNGENVKTEVDNLLFRLNELPESERATALFLRAFSAGVKAKAYEHTVCTILEDIGVENVAAKDGFPLEELSLEAIIDANPDFIFVVPMGDEEAANASLEASLLSNPAFNNLSAVENGHLIMLPKDLYHYKPNRRWGEAYETLLTIIYPQVFGEK